MTSTIKERIREVVSDADFSSVTITILFTDDGFSVGHRGEGGLEFTFFSHPKRDPAEESAIRELFDGFGVPPHVDYSADRGRTRVLAFAAPENMDELAHRVDRVLRHVYRMREGDILRYHFHRK